MARPDAPAVPRRRRGLVAGLASLAAGIAAIALIGPQTAPHGPVSPAHNAAAMAFAPAVTVPAPAAMASGRLPAVSAVPPHTFARAAVPGAGGARVRPDDHAQSNGAEMTGSEIASAPAVPLSGDVALVAVIPVRRPVYGPVDTEAPSPAFAEHGSAWSAQSIGYGFVGSDSGAARASATARSFVSP